MKIFKHLSALLLLLLVVGCGGGSAETKSGNIVVDEVVEPTYLYGIDIKGYEIANDTVRMGETVGGILGRRGISAVTVDRLDKASKEIFPLKKIRADNAYTTFTRSYTDSLGEHSALDYIVYHKNAIDYVVFGFVGDSISVTLGSRPVELIRKRCEASITSSLWGTIMEYKISENVKGVKPSAIREIFKFLSVPGLISFAAGNPSPESFPAEAMRHARRFGCD